MAQARLPRLDYRHQQSALLRVDHVFASERLTGALLDRLTTTFTS
jgi:hypothetical protein